MNRRFWIFSEGIILDDYCCTSDVLTLSLQMYFVNMYYVAQMCCPSRHVFKICVLCWHVRFYLRIKSHWCDWRKKSAHRSSHSGRHNVYAASRRSSLHTAAADPQLLESRKAEVQESAGQWQRAWSEGLNICCEDLFWKEAFRVLQLVNTPDIYEENKYQRRNLLLYHCLLELGLRKFNVSQQLLTPTVCPW
jgi:hypothetical protein